MRKMNLMMKTAIVAAVLTLPITAYAQSSRWTTEEQSSSWYGAFVDHAVSERTALWFDAQWRRMGIGENPQQLLIRPGVQRTLAPGVRVATGYAYVATAPYGALPSAAPTREHRLWQQLLLSHRAGAVNFTHRYRWEQRWLSSVLEDGGRTPSAFQNRARYMARAQGALPAVQVGSRPAFWFVWDELFLPVGHGDAAVRLAQNRLGGGVGVPIDARQRVELGYMNLWNGVPAQRANEVNHTFTLSWVWSSAR